MVATAAASARACARGGPLMARRCAATEQPALARHAATVRRRAGASVPEASVPCERTGTSRPRQVFLEKARAGSRAGSGWAWLERRGAASSAGTPVATPAPFRASVAPTPEASRLQHRPLCAQAAVAPPRRPPGPARSQHARALMSVPPRDPGSPQLFGKLRGRRPYDACAFVVRWARVRPAASSRRIHDNASTPHAPHHGTNKRPR